MTIANILTLTLSDAALATVEAFAARAGMTPGSWLSEQVSQAFSHRHAGDTHIPTRFLRNARRDAWNTDDDRSS